MEYDPRRGPRRLESDRAYTYEDYAREPKGGRSFFTVLAIFWLTAGITLIGGAGYLYWDSLQGDDAWVYVRPTFEDPEAVVAAAARGPAPLGAEEYHLEIDRIGVNAPVAPFGLDENALPEIPYEADLVAWYTFSAPPGTGENAVFAGHKTWDGEAVFYDLGNLAAGDGITLRGPDGTALIYRVSSVGLVEPTDAAAREWMQPVGSDVITLITCGGDRFETDTEIGADYTHRQVVRGELVTIQPPG